MAGAPVFERITVIGLGLIGSSIARAAREYHLAETIIGCDQSKSAVNYCRAHRIIDSAIADPKTAVQKSQLVILATPLSSYKSIARQIAPGLAPGALVMDVASVKRAAMKAIGDAFPPHVHFVPAHPIAGSEKTGPGAGSADLFKGKRVIVTPAEPLPPVLLQTVNAFWTGMGARVDGMPPEVHDVIYAYVSHLPQLLAFAAAQAVGRKKPPENPLLEKFLRLSQSSPAPWTEIFLLNRDNLLAALERYLDALMHIERELMQAPEAAAQPDAGYQMSDVKKVDSLTSDLWALTSGFPRIAASCLITTVMEAEKRQGISFKRYAGTGLADFTAPAAPPPDQDIEHISRHYRPVAALLASYRETLAAWRALIAAGNASKLQKALASGGN